MFWLKNVEILTVVIILMAHSNQGNIEKNSTNRGSNLTVFSKIATEGGSLPPDKVLPHTGREHVVDKPPLNTVSEPKNLGTPNQSAVAKGDPKHNDTFNQQEKKTAGKLELGKNPVSNITIVKAVKLNSNTPPPKMNTSSTTVSSTSTTHTKGTSTTTTKGTTVKPKKPTITEHDDIAPVNKKPESYSPSISNIDSTFDKSKRANYVVPIVAVILSIPLITILFSFLFKRYKDWWHHRNYRRMDFLIEGMYNS